MHFQNSLPKLPVPTLEDSLQRMLYAAEPLATAAELEEMRTLADEFASGHGKPLQEALVAKDKAIYSSFITEPWFDMYLKDRRPLLLNQNPQLTFKDEEGTRGGPGTQLARAARLVHGAATFQRTLETNQLIPDIFHTQPRTRRGCGRRRCGCCRAGSRSTAPPRRRLPARHVAVRQPLQVYSCAWSREG